MDVAVIYYKELYINQWFSEGPTPWMVVLSQECNFYESETATPKIYGKVGTVEIPGNNI